MSSGGTTLGEEFGSPREAYASAGSATAPRARRIREACRAGGRHMSGMQPPRPRTALCDRPNQPAEAAAGAPEGVSREDRITAELMGSSRSSSRIDRSRRPARRRPAASDERAGAAAYIDVEATSRTVEALLERGEGADLVHAANDTAAGEGQRITGPRPVPPEAHRAMYDLHPAAQISKALAKRHCAVTPWNCVGPL